jgi:predicted RNase H-like nuclease (RuvC/YqgF family)
MDAERLRESIATARTQIEDLQAELEAGARCADRIHADVKTIDDRVMHHIRQTTRMTALLECASELRKSIQDQRAILGDLRRSVDKVRQSIRRRITR